VRHTHDQIVATVHVPGPGTLEAIATHGDGPSGRASRLADAIALAPGRRRFTWGSANVAVTGPGKLRITVQGSAQAIQLLSSLPHPHLQLSVVFRAPSGRPQGKSVDVRL
jgi:hypothetical protein